MALNASNANQRLPSAGSRTACVQSTLPRSSTAGRSCRTQVHCGRQTVIVCKTRQRVRRLRPLFCVYAPDHSDCFAYYSGFGCQRRTNAQASKLLPRRRNQLRPHTYPASQNTFWMRRFCISSWPLHWLNLHFATSRSQTDGIVRCSPPTPSGPARWNHLIRAFSATVSNRTGTAQLENSPVNVHL